MLFKKKPVFIGLHFSKTGGTSVKTHVTHELGKRKTYSVGKPAYGNDFFAGRPLLPELTDREKSRIRFVFGHSVGADVLPHFADRDIVLFVICRDPYKRFLSSLKHKIRMRRKFGGDAAERKVFNSQPANPFSKNVLKHFGSLAPDTLTDEKDRLVAVLKHFQFVMSTDELDAHSKPFFKALGISPMHEAKRVYRDKIEPQLSEDTVYERDDLDTFVNTSVRTYFAEQADPAILKELNPFGFEDGRLKATMETLASTPLSRAQEIEETYLGVFQFLDSNQRLEAAKVLVDANKITPERKGYFETFCRNTNRTFSDDDLTPTKLCYMAEVYMRLGQPKVAAGCVQRAVDGQPDNAQAHFLLGKLAVSQKQYAEAIPALERAIEINPTHAESLRQLAFAQKKLGRVDQARDSLARAEKV